MSSSQDAAFQHGKSSPSFPHKYLYLRIAGYILLEGAFLTLAALALAHPLVISTFLSQTNAKAMFTVVFIVWHFLATQCLQEIIQHIFASEWQYIMQQSNSLTPGSTDRTSTLISGYLDFIPHFFTRHASTAFRLALPAQLLCLVISGLLPGTIIFTSVQVDITIPFEVANMTRTDTTLDLELGQSRAELVVQAEIRENSTFGLDTQKNWVVGWPKTPENFDYSITYPTDVVRYDFKCRWEAPEFTSSIMFQSSGGVRWLFVDDLFRVNDPITTAQFYRVISQGMPAETSGSQIAFLFFGSNQTHQVPSTTHSWGTILNLDGIPTTFHAAGFSINPVISEAYNASAPLAALLLCDPQLQISSGQAVIWPNRTLNIVESSLNSSDRVGNFPDDDVETWFRSGHRNVFRSVPNDDSLIVFEDSMLNFNCAFTFLNHSSILRKAFVDGHKGIFTLPIDQIQANLNTVFRSIFKAYSDGIRSDRVAWGVFAQDTTPVQAVTRRPAQALVTNANLFYIAVVLVVAELLLMGVLCAIRDWQNRDPLNLRSIFTAIGREANTSEKERDPLEDPK